MERIKESEWKKGLRSNDFPVEPLKIDRIVETTFISVVRIARNENAFRYRNCVVTRSKIVDYLSRSREKKDSNSITHFVY